jgi:hypothetical protein
MDFDPSEDDDSGAPDSGLPDDIAGRLTYTPEAEDDDFDESQKLLGSPGTEAQQHLAAVQAAQAKIKNWLSTFHGAEPEGGGRLRQQVDGGKISGADYYAMTGRIYSGGSGDTPTRDARGNITGYTAADGSGSPLGGPSDTPGLDAFHAMNPDASSSPGFSFMPDGSSPTPLPGSVAATVGGAPGGVSRTVAPAPGMVFAGSTARLTNYVDPRPPGQYGKAGTAGSTRVFSPVTRGTANQVTSQF